MTTVVLDSATNDNCRCCCYLEDDGHDTDRSSVASDSSDFDRSSYDEGDEDQVDAEDNGNDVGDEEEYYYNDEEWQQDDDSRPKSLAIRCWTFIAKYYTCFQVRVKALTGKFKNFHSFSKIRQKLIYIFLEHKYFQQALLGAILVNTLSMGIEYHNQVCIQLHFLFKTSK